MRCKGLSGRARGAAVPMPAAPPPGTVGNQSARGPASRFAENCFRLPTHPRSQPLKKPRYGNGGGIRPRREYSPGVAMLPHFIHAYTCLLTEFSTIAHSHASNEAAKSNAIWPNRNCILI